MIMERFLRWNKILEDENIIMLYSGYMDKVQKSAGRKDTLMKPATDANKSGQLCNFKFQLQNKINGQVKI